MIVANCLVEPAAINTTPRELYIVYKLGERVDVVNDLSTLTSKYPDAVILDTFIGTLSKYNHWEITQLQSLS